MTEGMGVSMKASNLIKRALMDDPEVRLVLEIAVRTRQAESTEPPKNVASTTDIVALPTNSQSPVPPMTSV